MNSFPCMRAWLASSVFVPSLRPVLAALLGPAVCSAAVVDHRFADWTPAPNEEVRGEHVNVGHFRVPGDRQIFIKSPASGSEDNGGKLIVRAEYITINGNVRGEGRGFGGGGGGGAGGGGDQNPGGGGARGGLASLNGSGNGYLGSAGLAGASTDNRGGNGGAGGNGHGYPGAAGTAGAGGGGSLVVSAPIVEFPGNVNVAGGRDFSNAGGVEFHSYPGARSIPDTLGSARAEWVRYLEDVRPTLPMPQVSISASGGSVRATASLSQAGVYPPEAGVVLRHTLDGSTPGASSPLCAGSFTVPAGVTLRVRAIAAKGWDPGPTATVAIPAQPVVLTAPGGLRFDGEVFSEEPFLVWWNAVPGATAYTVEVLDAEGRVLASAESTTTSASLQVSEPPGGYLTARVTPRADATTGPSSAPADNRVAAALTLGNSTGFSTTVEAGQPASLTCHASHRVPGRGYSFTWSKLGTAGKWDAPLGAEPATTDSESTLSFPAAGLEATGLYRCDVREYKGGREKEKRTRTFALFVRRPGQDNPNHWNRPDGVFAGLQAVGLARWDEESILELAKRITASHDRQIEIASLPFTFDPGPNPLGKLDQIVRLVFGTTESCNCASLFHGKLRISIQLFFDHSNKEYSFRQDTGEIRGALAVDWNAFSTSSPSGGTFKRELDRRLALTAVWLRGLPAGLRDQLDVVIVPELEDSSDGGRPGEAEYNNLIRYVWDALDGYGVDLAGGIQVGFRRSDSSDDDNFRPTRSDRERHGAYSKTTVDQVAQGDCYSNVTEESKQDESDYANAANHTREIVKSGRSFLFWYKAFNRDNSGESKNSLPRDRRLHPFST